MRSWKTALSGIIIILTAVSRIVNEPQELTNPSIIAEILTGLGLIFAKDFNVTGNQNRSIFSTLKGLLFQKESDSASK